MLIVPTNIYNLLKFRRSKNTELFAKCTDDGKSVTLYTKGTDGLILSTEVGINNVLYRSVLPYCNTPLAADSLMLRTHDYSDASTWGETNLYHLIPYAGYKLVITSLVARIPSTVDLNNNNIHFRVFKSYDGITPVNDESLPVLDDTYTSITDLLEISNCTATTVTDPTGAFSSDIYEIKFRYADSDMSPVSKLTLYSSLGEFMEIGMDHDVALVDSLGNAIHDPCYLFFNTKRMVDF